MVFLVPANESLALTDCVETPAFGLAPFFPCAAAAFSRRACSRAALGPSPPILIVPAFGINSLIPKSSHAPRSHVLQTASANPIINNLSPSSRTFFSRRPRAALDSSPKPPLCTNLPPSRRSSLPGPPPKKAVSSPCSPSNNPACRPAQPARDQVFNGCQTIVAMRRRFAQAATTPGTSELWTMTSDQAERLAATAADTKVAIQGLLFRLR